MTLWLSDTVDYYWQLVELELWHCRNSIYNQIVTWTAFAILAMFSDKSSNFGKISSQCFLWGPMCNTAHFPKENNSYWTPDNKQKGTVWIFFPDVERKTFLQSFYFFVTCWPKANKKYDLESQHVAFLTSSSHDSSFTSLGSSVYIPSPGSPSSLHCI